MYCSAGGTNVIRVRRPHGAFGQMVCFKPDPHEPQNEEFTSRILYCSVLYCLHAVQTNSNLEAIKAASQAKDLQLDIVSE